MRRPPQRSAASVKAADRCPGANLTHRGDPAFDTADFVDVPGSGNLRVEYVLPSKNLRILDGAVFWPLSTDPLFRLVSVFSVPDL